jgi:hypothetical protein
MDKTMSEAGRFIAEISEDLAKHDKRHDRMATLTFKALHELIIPEYIEHRTVDLEIMYRIIMDILFPLIRERMPSYPKIR